MTFQNAIAEISSDSNDWCYSNCAYFVKTNHVFELEKYCIIMDMEWEPKEQIKVCFSILSKGP